MNFLLHRHLAAAACGSEIAGIGAMLPDLWRMADRRVRASRVVEFEGDGPLAHLFEGIAHHLAADARFHKSDVFARGEALVAEVMKTLAAPRARLFAHIGWELCLDGELVRREGVDEVLAALRRGFARADQVMFEAAAAHHFDRVDRDPSDREAFEHRLRRIVHGLARGPWVAGYQSGQGIADRISGVRIALGLTPFDPEDRARLAAGLDGLAGTATIAVDELFDDAGYFQTTSRAANRSARCS